jgi:hypothetical protein
MSDSSRNVRIASAGHDQPSAQVAVAQDDSVPRRAPYVMMALALIGLAVAFYDSYAIYNGQLLWCPPPINGCNEVAASPYARIICTCSLWRRCSHTILWRAGCESAPFFTPR